jgi:anti-sigma regulatory factor (Ser/Thr protein kinase)
MTGRATFGDFAAAISKQLGSLPRSAPSLAAGHRPDADIAETAGAVRAAIRPMASHVADVMAVFKKIDTHEYHRHAAWLRAAKRARQALADAEGFLESEFGVAEQARDQAGNRKAVALLASAASMAASRDLLHTHSATRADDSRTLRSEWAPVTTSIPIARAVLLEVAGWASQIAPHCGQAAISGMTGSHEQRRALNAACQWLWTLAWAVEAAHEQQPVAAEDIELLHAIPVGISTSRHLPAGRVTVAGLCDGIITAAERAHSEALAEARTPPLAAGPSSESFRHVAGNCAITSWNCHLVLQGLAGRKDIPAPLRAQLRNAAQATDQARAAWLRTVSEWDTITTSVRGGLSSAAVDAEDLALWTGRLAYADPDWTPALGPSSTPRAPDDLLTSPGALRHVVTAIHHACHVTSRLAAHNHEQAQEAATRKRLVVPARNLIDSSGGRYLMGFATPADASPLRSAYRDAMASSERAEEALGVLATAVRAPSRALTTTRASRRTRTATTRPHAAGLATRLRKHAAPGPAERVLRDLGITNHADLKLASDLDKATSQLTIRAARTTGPAARRSPNLTASPGTAELINHLLATSEGNAAFNHPDPPAAPRDQASRAVRVLLRTQLPRDLSAPGQARRHVRQALADNGLSALTDDAELLTSEIVANAAEHGHGTTIGLTVSENTAANGRPGITCEISDRSPQLPERQRAGPGDERGRGLAILDALATDSGIRTSPHGKTCWFTLTATPATRTAELQAEREAGA